MIRTDYFKQLAQNEGFELSEKQLAEFDAYASLLVEYNKNVNLTAITEPDDIVVKHFLDSIMLLKAAKIEEGATLIDVGTGAGFPSVPLKLVRNDISVTLLDSLNKRISFLQKLSDELQIDASCVHMRAEDGGRDPLYRESFDIATARAVAAMRELSEYCLPFVKVGGRFIALKGSEIESELEEAKAAIKALGGKINSVVEYSLPNGDMRHIVVIDKISTCDAKFPRMPAKIKKTPLK